MTTPQKRKGGAAQQQTSTQTQTTTQKTKGLEGASVTSGGTSSNRQGQFVKPKLPDERERERDSSATSSAPSKKSNDSSQPAPAPTNAKLKPTGPILVGPVLPPTPVPLALPHPPTVLKLGPGLRLQDSTPVISQAGILFRSVGLEKTKTGRVQTERWHVERIKSGFYLPSVGDPLVLTVLQRSPYGTECYLCSYTPLAPPLLLPYLAFENATKRNKPELKQGDLVYARVTRMGAGEGEVECLAGSGRAEGFGELKGGTVAKVQAGICRRCETSASESSLLFEANPLLSTRLLSSSHHLLPALGSHFTFDIAIGLNSQIWISAPSVLDTLCIIACIKDLGSSLLLEKEETNKRVGVFVRSWREKQKGRVVREVEVDRLLASASVRRIDDEEEESGDDEEAGDMDVDA